MGSLGTYVGHRGECGNDLVMRMPYFRLLDTVREMDWGRGGMICLAYPIFLKYLQQGVDIDNDFHKLGNKR